MCEVLLRQVLVVEEKPVVTRVFLFAPCCFAFLRMSMLGLSSDVQCVGDVNPAVESTKRLKAVNAFFARGQTPALLRKACLCLRLTLFATSLTPQETG